MVVGAGLCVLVLVTTGFGAQWPYAERGLGFGPALLLYATGGIVGGASVGMVLPLLRSPAGAGVVGAMAVLPFAAGVVVAVMGAGWTLQHTIAVVIVLAVLGAPGGVIISLTFRSEIKGAERRWRRILEETSHLND